MIEASITCDRCGKQGSDGALIGMGLSITTTSRLHLCSVCLPDFYTWMAQYKPSRRKDKEVA